MTFSTITFRILLYRKSDPFQKSQKIILKTVLFNYLFEILPVIKILQRLEAKIPSFLPKLHPLQTFRVKLSSPPIPDIIRDWPLTSFREHGSRGKSRGISMKLPRRNSSGDEHTGLHTRSANKFLLRVSNRTRSLSLSFFAWLPVPATSVDGTNFGSERAYVSWQCLPLLQAT